MSEFFGFLQTALACGTLFGLVFLVLLALPQSRLRCVGLEVAKWALCAGMVLLIVSPIDFLPGIPLDDIAYVIGAFVAGRSALGEGQKRKLYDAVELSELQARVKDVTPASEKDATGAGAVGREEAA
ncbi:MAG: hypothetical protein AB7N24_22275 [Dehalococcoidia bacterium]